MLGAADQAPDGLAETECRHRQVVALIGRLVGVIGAATHGLFGHRRPARRDHRVGERCEGELVDPHEVQPIGVRDVDALPEASSSYEDPPGLGEGLNSACVAEELRRGDRQAPSRAERPECFRDRGRRRPRGGENHRTPSDAVRRLNSTALVGVVLFALWCRGHEIGVVRNLLGHAAHAAHRMLDPRGEVGEAEETGLAGEVKGAFQHLGARRLGKPEPPDDEVERTGHRQSSRGHHQTRDERQQLAPRCRAPELDRRDAEGEPQVARRGRDARAHILGHPDHGVGRPLIVHDEITNRARVIEIVRTSRVERACSVAVGIGGDIIDRKVLVVVVLGDHVRNLDGRVRRHKIRRLLDDLEDRRRRALAGGRVAIVGARIRRSVLA